MDRALFLLKVDPELPLSGVGRLRPSGEVSRIRDDEPSMRKGDFLYVAPAEVDTSPSEPFGVFQMVMSGTALEHTEYATPNPTPPPTPSVFSQADRVFIERLGRERELQHDLGYVTEYDQEHNPETWALLVLRYAGRVGEAAEALIANHGVIPAMGPGEISAMRAINRATFCESFVKLGAICMAAHAASDWKSTQMPDFSAANISEAYMATVNPNEPIKRDEPVDPWAEVERAERIGELPSVDNVDLARMLKDLRDHVRSVGKRIG